VNQSQHLLEVQELKTQFYTFDGLALAVNDVSFTLDRQETSASSASRAVAKASRPNQLCA
jgi:ABC-type microcin C transport system duplicated ATPase subunit YejF